MASVGPYASSALRSRQITTPAPHNSVSYRPDALPAAQTTASKHCASTVWPTLGSRTAQEQNSCSNIHYTQVRKTTHGLDGHQDVDRTPRGRVNQNDRTQRKMEQVRPRCGQPSDRGRLKNRTVVVTFTTHRRGRPRTAWMDNIKTWTGLPSGVTSHQQPRQRRGPKTVNGAQSYATETPRGSVSQNDRGQR